MRNDKSTYKYAELWIIVSHTVYKAFKHSTVGCLLRHYYHCSHQRQISFIPFKTISELFQIMIKYIWLISINSAVPVFISMLLRQIQIIPRSVVYQL